MAELVTLSVGETCIDIPDGDRLHVDHRLCHLGGVEYPCTTCVTIAGVKQCTQVASFADLRSWVTTHLH